jgi:preprotein translocase subunit SecD
MKKNARRMTQAVALLVWGACLAGCLRPSGQEMQLTLQLTPEGMAAETALAEARKTIAERLEEAGFRNPVVETVGRDRLAVRIAGVEDPARVRRLIRANAVFELRFVRSPALESEEAVLAHFKGQLPPDLEILPEEVRGENGQAVETKYYAVEKRPVITGRDLRTARPGVGPFNDPIVAFEVKPEATATFAEATGANIGSRLAIVLDGRVVSAPTINARISDSGIIEGGFTREQAQDLAIMLRSGPLPARLTVVDERIGGQSGG